MFEVEAVERTFLGRRARLKALGRSGGDYVVATEAGSWAITLPETMAAGDIVDVRVPAYVQLQVGQTLNAGN